MRQIEHDAASDRPRGKMMLRSAMIALAFGMCGTPACAVAQEVAVTRLVSGLSNPSGLAIRPGGTPQRFEIVLADAGRQRIAKIRSDSPQDVADVVTGFSEQAGPAGLFFLDRDRMVVGLHSGANDSNMLLFEVKDEPLPVAQAVQKLALVEQGDSEASVAVNIHSFARSGSNDRVPDFLIATTHGDDDQPGLWKIPIRAGTLDKPIPFASIRQRGAPAAVIVSKQGYVLVASSHDDASAIGSRLSFYNPIDASKVMELNVDLGDIRGLAYSPNTGNLYAANYGPGGANFAPEKSGVFRIDDASELGKPACRAVKVADVLRPMAIVFGPDRALYVLAEEDNSGGASGNCILAKLTGEL